MNSSSMDVEGRKICPECAETIKAAARICPHCQSAQPRVHGLLSSLTGKQMIALVAALLIVVLVLSLWRPLIDYFAPAPVPVTVASMERDFDLNADAALNHWRNRPMLLSGVAKGMDRNDLLLETIDFAPVRAHLRSWDFVANGTPVVLHCRSVKLGGMFGDKFEPLDCNVVKADDR